MFATIKCFQPSLIFRNEADIYLSGALTVPYSKTLLDFSYWFIVGVGVCLKSLSGNKKHAFELICRGVNQLFKPFCPARLIVRKYLVNHSCWVTSLTI